MANWENLRHLAALAESGTLSAAARSLGVEHATISRRIEGLEAETGLKLVDRRGRRLSLTKDGERIADIARKMESVARGVERARIVGQSELSAEITVSAPPSYAAARLVPPIAALRQHHPGIRIRVIGEARQSSLDRREADIAIRLSRPMKGELTILKIGTEAFRPYASAAYLAGTPPEQWAFIAYDESLETTPQQARLLALAKDRPIGLRANTLEIQLAFAKASGGVAMLPDFVAAGSTLSEALPDEPPVTRDVWLVVHTDVKEAPAIRAVIEAFRNSLAPSRMAARPVAKSRRDP